MAPRMLCLGFGLLLVACSGGKNRDTQRDLGSSGRDAQADASEEEEEEPVDEPDAASEQDAAAEKDAAAPVPMDASAEPADASLDAELDAASAVDGGLDAALADSAVADSALPDAGADADAQPPADFSIRVSVENPRGHENPIQFAWAGEPTSPDANGVVRGPSAAAPLDVIMGESDETEVLRFLDVRSGDQLQFLYRHFRELRQFRDVVLPSGQRPPGTAAVAIGDAVLSQGESVGSTRFYSVGNSDYLAQAVAESVEQRVLGYALAKDVAPATTPVMLGAWLTPNQVTVTVLNAPPEATRGLIMRNANDQSFPAALGAQGQAFAVPPDFAQRLEAHVVLRSVEATRVVSSLVGRCGPGSADSFTLDFAEALPPATASVSVGDGEVTWTFVDPGPTKRGDLLVFDGVFMPATRTSLSLPGDNAAGAHYVLRVDLASAADYQALKQIMRFDLDITDLGGAASEGVLNRLSLCSGTDTVRATLVQFETQD